MSVVTTISFTLEEATTYLKVPAPVCFELFKRVFNAPLGGVCPEAIEVKIVDQVHERVLMLTPELLTLSVFNDGSGNVVDKQTLFDYIRASAASAMDLSTWVEPTPPAEIPPVEPLSPVDEEEPEDPPAAPVA